MFCPSSYTLQHENLEGTVEEVAVGEGIAHEKTKAEIPHQKIEAGMAVEEDTNESGSLGSGGDREGHDIGEGGPTGA